MILGMSVLDLTLLHVAISLIGIFTGLAVLGQMIANKPLGPMNAVFLLTTVATSVTGFMFHSTSFGPPQIIGALSLAVLTVTLFALYGRHLAGRWRGVYTGRAVFALYLNVFVLVVQSFQKIPSLMLLAPTQKEPPFLIVQAGTLGAFAVLGFLAVKRFRAGIASP